MNSDKNGGDKPPLPIRYPSLACGQLPDLNNKCVQIYNGSAGSIPARQIDRDVNKLRYALPKPGYCSWAFVILYYIFEQSIL